MSPQALSPRARFAVLFAAIGGLLFDGVELGLMPVASASVSLPDVWDRHGRKGSHPAGFLTVAAADLWLNAAVPAPERAFAKEQAYVMVGVLDAKGQSIAEFEAGKCVISKEDRRAIPLKWSETSARQLAGTTIRLRCFLRSTDIYAVTSQPQL